MGKTKQRTILLTGGGSGGHITPILAVAHEVKTVDPTVKVVYVGERGSKFSELTNNHAAVDETHIISAGKLRRYHGESWVTRLFDVRTNLFNIRDMFRFLVGTVQAMRLLGKIKPDVVFQKGGFVGVPVGLAAALRHIPIVTHDSDALPGLANRMVSRWARIHATALPAKYYPYPKTKVMPVGVLVEHTYQPVDAAQQVVFKQKLGLPVDGLLLLVTGGSSGAERINTAMTEIVDTLLTQQPNLHIIHQTGKGKADVYGGFVHDRLQVLEFLHPMYQYMGAADLIVCRASANTLAEIGVQGKAAIAIPSEFLAGGHQLKNAQILQEQGAAEVIYEDKLQDTSTGLSAMITKLLTDTEGRKKLAATLSSQTITDAAQRLAGILLEQSDTGRS